MTKRQARKPKPQREAISLYPCMHCGTERIISPWTMLVGLNRKHPLPGMDEALIELRLHLDSRDDMVGICPGCGCLTSADYGAHEAH